MITYVAVADTDTYLKLLTLDATLWEMQLPRAQAALWQELWDDLGHHGYNPFTGSPPDA